MAMFTSKHKQTKKSYLGNAILAFLIGVFMIVSAAVKEDLDAEYIQGTAVGVGIVWLLGIYWVKKHLSFDEKNNDENKQSKAKKMMDKLGL